MLRVARTILTLAVAGVLQTVATGQHLKTVVWSGDSGCGWKNSAVYPSEIYQCTSTETPRGSVSSILHNKVSLAVAFLDHDDLITVAVEITNRNAEPLMFDAENWGAAHFRGREDFITGKKPIIAETSIPSRDMTRQISRRTSSDNSLDEYMADIQRTIETIEVRKEDGSRVRVKKTVPDVEQQQTAESRSESRSMLAKNSTEQMRRNSLTAKTVAANGSVRGLVYFRRIKKARYVVFSMTLDDTNYLFLLPRSEN